MDPAAGGPPAGADAGSAAPNRCEGGSRGARSHRRRQCQQRQDSEESGRPDTSEVSRARSRSAPQDSPGPAYGSLRLLTARLPMNAAAAARRSLRRDRNPPLVPRGPRRLCCCSASRWASLEILPVRATHDQRGRPPGPGQGVGAGGLLRLRPDPGHAGPAADRPVHRSGRPVRPAHHDAGLVAQRRRLAGRPDRPPPARPTCSTTRPARRRGTSSRTGRPAPARPLIRLPADLRPAAADTGPHAARPGRAPTR